MNVELIGHTVATEKFAHLNTATDFIAYVARVSNPSNQGNLDTSEKLIRYLIKNKHWSPLEMYNVVLEVNTTRDIARQLLRHRSFSFQEFSQRYADPTKDLDMELREARMQDHKNRQNSIETDDIPLNDEWLALQDHSGQLAQYVYNWAIEKGIAKEVARSVLPEGMMGSRLYVNGTLRSWIHYCALRCGNGTQLEHKNLAFACAAAIESVFPLINEIIEVTIPVLKKDGDI